MSTSCDFIKTKANARFIFRSGLSTMTHARQWLLLEKGMENYGKYLVRMFLPLSLLFGIDFHNAEADPRLAAPQGRYSYQANNARKAAE
jgi:hypothetical protein